MAVRQHDLGEVSVWLERDPVFSQHAEAVHARFMQRFSNNDRATLESAWPDYEYLQLVAMMALLGLPVSVQERDAEGKPREGVYREADGVSIRDLTQWELPTLYTTEADLREFLRANHCPQPETSLGAMTSYLIPGDPYSRLKWMVPDAEPLEQLLLHVKADDRDGTEIGAIEAMQRGELEPAVQLEDGHWRCSRGAFLAWLDEQTRKQEEQARTQGDSPLAARRQIDPLQRIPYTEAFRRLEKRHPRPAEPRLSVGEVAMWVWQWTCKPSGGKGLPAYNRYGEPFSWDGTHSLRDIRSCWFDPDELQRFGPTARWLTYRQLVERWRPLCDDPEQEIRDGIERHRDEQVLMAHDPLSRSNPPIEDTMFLLREVEASESEWFEDVAMPYQLAIERLRDRLQARDDEPAMWVWSGELTAYTGDTLGERFIFDDSPDTTDFRTGRVETRTGLIGACFNRAEIEAFQPLNRWLTYPQVVERWAGYCGATEIPGELQSAKEQGRLIPCHPLAHEADEDAIMGMLFTEAEIHALEQRNGWLTGSSPVGMPSSATGQFTGTGQPPKAPPKLRQIVRALMRMDGNEEEPPKYEDETLRRARELVLKFALDQLLPYEAASKIENFATLNGITIPKDKKTIVKHLNKALEADFR